MLKMRKTNELLVSYGAADEFAAVMRLDYNEVVKTLRQYPYKKG